MLLPCACVRKLYRDLPEGMPLVAAELVTLQLTSQHESTGRQPGVYAALVMPVYVSTVAKLLQLQPSVLLEQGKRIQRALEFMHKCGLVHMDIKVWHGYGGVVRMYVEFMVLFTQCKQASCSCISVSSLSRLRSSSWM